MAAYNDNVARRPGSTGFTSCIRDGDREPVEALSTASPWRPAARPSKHDDRPVPASPPSSGIERDEMGGEPSVVYPLPTGTSGGSSSGSNSGTPGNMRQASHRANGNLRTNARETDNRRKSDYGDGDDGQAISAVALLLLAASSPARRAPPVDSGAAGRGASATDSPIGHMQQSQSSSSSGSSTVAEDAAAAHRRSRHIAERGATPAFSVVPGPSTTRVRETRTAPRYPSSQTAPHFVENDFFGVVGLSRGSEPAIGDGNGWSRDVGEGKGPEPKRREGYSGGKSVGSSMRGYPNGDHMPPNEAQRRPSSLPYFFANGHSPTSSVYPGEQGRARGPHSSTNCSSSGGGGGGGSRFGFGSTTLTTARTPDQESVPYYSYDHLPSSSKVRRFNEFANDGLGTAAPHGGGDGYGGPSIRLPQTGRGDAYWQDDNRGVMKNEHGGDASSFPTMMGTPLRVQMPWRHDGPGPTAPSAMPAMLRSPPQGARSPSPPRTAGRKKPEGYRVPTGEGAAARGWKTTSSGCGGGGGRVASRRWAPLSPRGAGVGGGAAAGIPRVGRKVSGTPARGGKDGGSKGGPARDGGNREAGWTGRGLADGRADLGKAFSSVAGAQQRPQQPRQRPAGEREVGDDRTRCPRKRSNVAMNETHVSDPAGGPRQEQQQRSEKVPLHTASAKGTVGRAQWRNGRAALRAAAAAAAAVSTASTGANGPRPSKRHRSGGAQRTSANRSSKVVASRRPLAMDMDEDSPDGGAVSETAEPADAAATKECTATNPGRPTTSRKKCKSLVWSQFRKACDRCTDKKVRCDGSNPTGGFKACTPCKRAEVPCLFGICRRSGPRDAHGHKTAAAGVIMKRKDFEKVTERFGQCRTEACRFVNEDGSFWKEHFHCRVESCSFAGKTMSELLLHRGNDHPELAAGEVAAASSASAEEDGGSSFKATSDENLLTSALVTEAEAAVAAAGVAGAGVAGVAVVPLGNGRTSGNAGGSNKRVRREAGAVF